MECVVDIDGNNKFPNLHICVDYENDRVVRKGNEEIVKFLN